MPKLRIERLAELSTDDLISVAGGAEYAITKPYYECLHTVFGCTTNIYCP